MRGKDNRDGAARDVSPNNDKVQATMHQHYQDIPIHHRIGQAISEGEWWLRDGNGNGVALSWRRIEPFTNLDPGRCNCVNDATVRLSDWLRLGRWWLDRVERVD